MSPKDFYPFSIYTNITIPPPFLTKSYIFLAEKGFPPPPLADMSTNNLILFWRLP